MRPRATRTWLGRGGASRNLPRSLFVLFALLLTIGTTWACETPVYRYAMYRWQPTPYEVYSFHDDTNAEAHAAVEKAIADVSIGIDNRANVVFIPVNLTSDPDLNGVTPDIKAAWTSQKDRALPSYLISTPYGVQIYSGKLNAETIKTLVESPVRRQMAQQLEAGKIGVLLFLNGKDQKENDVARKILEGLVKEVAEGKISIYTAPNDNIATGEDESTSTNPGLELGFIEINRDDEKETWLIKSLLAMESDLPDESRPMVFLSYGRGRALLPYIGQGISRENLLREVEVISGPCSCTVKEQNPGVDLLVRYDWEAASAALAEHFGTEEGNEGQFGPTDFLPQLIIPSSSAPSVGAVTAAETIGDAGDSADGESNQADDNGGDVVASATDQIPTEDGQATPEVGTGAGGTAEIAVAAVDDPNGSENGTSFADSDGGPDVAAVTPTVTSPQTATIPTAFRPVRSYVSMLVVGGGLALGLVILFGLTFFVMRPH